MARAIKTYLNSVNVTPQTEKAKGTSKNNAGGYSFKTDKWTQLDRFLILGSDKGTYYVSEKKLTKDNVENVLKCIKEDGQRVVARAVEVSDLGLAAKTDPALFVHALASVEGDLETRQLAYSTLTKIARIGTHLLHWVDFRNSLGGWGSGARKAVAAWYEDKEADDLGFQVLKYANRDGWSHRDVLRLVHPKTADKQRDAIYRYIVGGWDALSGAPRNVSHKGEGKRSYRGYKVADLPEQFDAVRQLKEGVSVKEAIKLIQDYRLPREVVPTELLNEVKVWDALLPSMGVTAILRNLGKMTSVGLLKPLSDATKLVCDKISDENILKRGRVHPIAVLSALKIYGNGSGFKGKLTWSPVTQINNALEDSFYTSFGAVTPTGKKLILALDVSGSMSSPVMGLEFISCCEAATVMAMVTARVEDQYELLAFDHGLSRLPINKRTSLKDAMKHTQNINYGGTDCALPMMYAEQQRLDVDGFAVYTDSETWAGRIHPFQALKSYRKINNGAKLVVVGMTSNGFTIADPSDPGMLDVVGFDTNTPNVISGFLRGDF